MIPLLKLEVVDTNGWMTDEEFIDLYAVASSLPGPISTNLAGYLGWRVAGLLGAVCALIGLTAPTGIAMVALGGVYHATKDFRLVQGALAGIRPVVIALLMGVVVTFLPKALMSDRGRKGLALKGAAILVAFLAAVVTPLHPAVLIASGAIVGQLMRSTW